MAIITSADFVKTLPPGGDAGFVSNVIGHLGSPVTVFGIGINGTEPWKTYTLGPQVEFIPIADLRYPSSIPMRVKVLVAYLRNRRRIVKRPFRVLYVHSPECAIPFIFGRRRAAVIYHQHGSGNPVQRSKHPWARTKLLSTAFDLILREIHRRADWIVAIDSLCIEQAQRNGAGNKVSLLMNAVDTMKFKPVPVIRNEMRRDFCLEEGDRAVLFVGRLEEIKRTDRLVDTMALLKESHLSARLFIIGEGTQRERLENQAKERGVASHISMLGHVPHDQMARFYNMADVLVLCSDMEGVPMVLLEALACGTPVVASSVGGIPDLLAHNIHASVLPDASPVNLARAISELSTFSFDRQSVADSIKQHSSSAFVSELYRIIAELFTLQPGSRG